MVEHCYSVFICVFALTVLVRSVPLDNEIKEYGYEESFTQPSVTSFAIDLIQKLGEDLRPGDNILVSPVNAYAALLMLHLGAGEKTRSSLNQVLKLHESDRDFSRLHETFSDIFRRIENKHSSNADKEVTGATLTNGFFLQKDHPIHDSYIRSLKKYYAANATNLDFAAHADQATDAINSFIFEGTNRRIRRFYKDVLSTRTIAVLVSALYFHGQWKYPFSVDNTGQEKFYTGTGELQVSMMRRQEKLRYTYSDSLQFDSIDLEYTGGDYAMLINLPRPGQTIKNLTQHLHLIDHREITRNAKMVHVDCKVPKMKFAWKNSLVGPLQLEDVFRHADLSQMTTGMVLVSDMLQATEMEVDEHGTIATAATAISSSRLFKPTPPPEKLIQFYVDRPFIVSIIHRPTQMMLFYGVVQKPMMP